MARSRAVALLVAVVVGSLALGACGSSKKATGKTTTTSSSGGVTVPNSTGATTVNVALGDTNGTDGPMTLTATPSSATAGDVSITVKNAGTIDHEMIVLKTDTSFDQLPVVDAGDPPAPVATGADKVDEANNVGETGEPDLKAGESRTFTIKGLAAGRYVFACNIAKHYGLGMRAAFTVA
jgi:uncharacterized cupredoxin-like copper-binding protein